MESTNFGDLEIKRKCLSEETVDELV
jgi:hypothetical protein